MSDDTETARAATSALDEALLTPGRDGAAPEVLGNARGLETVKRIPVLLQVVLGSASMPVSSLLKLGRGAVADVLGQAGLDLAGEGELEHEPQADGHGRPPEARGG